jgi:hypothetical protein
MSIFLKGPSSLMGRGFGDIDNSIFDELLRSKYHQGKLYHQF